MDPTRKKGDPARATESPLSADGSRANVPLGRVWRAASAGGHDEDVDPLRDVPEAVTEDGQAQAPAQPAPAQQDNYADDIQRLREQLGDGAYQELRAKGLLEGIPGVGLGLYDNRGKATSSRAQLDRQLSQAQDELKAAEAEFATLKGPGEAKGGSGKDDVLGRLRFGPGGADSVAAPDREAPLKRARARVATLKARKRELMELDEVRQRKSTMRSDAGG